MGLFKAAAAAFGSGLLAKKGQATPAMRHRRSVTIALSPDLAHDDGADWDDDLGWNDMGEDVALAAGPAPTPAPAPLWLTASEERAPPPLPMPSAPQRFAVADPHADDDGEAGDSPVRPGSLAALVRRRPQLAAAEARAEPDSYSMTFRLDARLYPRLLAVMERDKATAQQVLVTAVERYLAAGEPAG